jgi:hypothetical protein
VSPAPRGERIERADQVELTREATLVYGRRKGALGRLELGETRAIVVGSVRRALCED